MNVERLETPTMDLRTVMTSVLAANYLVAQHTMTMLTDNSVASSLLILQSKFARELYRRAVEQSELAVEIDSCTYLIEPKAFNEIELIAI